MLQILSRDRHEPQTGSVLPDAGSVLSGAVVEDAMSGADDTPVVLGPGSEPSSGDADGRSPSRPEVAIIRTRKKLMRYLPQVVVATLLVAFFPVAAVWLLRSAGIVGSPWICLGLAMALSTVLSWAGCAYWQRSKGSGDLLFSELLVWGWLQRVRAERQLANAVQLLGPLATDEDGRAGPRPVGQKQQLLRRLAAALEAEDRYTRGHSDRVARYATRIARTLGLPKHDVETVRAAALVHDVGKLLIAPDILDKAAPLSNAEFEVIKRHPVDGANMVMGLRNDELTAIVRHHHERIDGSGYPDGLTGEQIPLGARIIAVADTFDAITSVRAYRPRREHKTALDILTSEQGRQLDREAVRAFLTCYSGRRSVAVWTVLTSLVQRSVAWLTGEASAATITGGNVLATAVATVAIGAVAMVSPLGVRAAPARVAAAHAALPLSASKLGLDRVGTAIGVRQPAAIAAQAAVNVPRRGPASLPAVPGGHLRRGSSPVVRRGAHHSLSRTRPRSFESHFRSTSPSRELRSGKPAHVPGKPRARGPVTGSHRPVPSGGRPSGAAAKGGTGTAPDVGGDRRVKAKRQHSAAKGHKPLPATAQGPRPARIRKPRPAQAHARPAPLQAPAESPAGNPNPGKAGAKAHGH